MITPPDKTELLRQGARTLRRGYRSLAFSSVALGLNAAVAIWLFRQGRWSLGMIMGAASFFLLCQSLNLWVRQRRFQRLHDKLTKEER